MVVDVWCELYDDFNDHPYKIHTGNYVDLDGYSYGGYSYELDPTMDPTLEKLRLGGRTTEGTIPGGLLQWRRTVPWG